MLDFKASCKDCWQQVLTEVDRIDVKHLLTLQPGVSTTQTDEMLEECLQLVKKAAAFFAKESR
jgi:EcoRII C terminal